MKWAIIFTIGSIIAIITGIYGVIYEIPFMTTNLAIVWVIGMILLFIGVNGMSGLFGAILKKLKNIKGKA